MMTVEDYIKETEGDATGEKPQSVLDYIAETEPAHATDVALETMADMANVAHQAGSFYLSDEIAGAASSLHDSMTGKSPIEARATYERVRDGVRKSVSESRERSPIATTITDVITPDPATFIPGGSTAMRLLKSGLGRGAISGFGIGEGGAESAGYAGLGAASGGLMDAAGKAFRAGFGDPAGTRQTALGAGVRDFEEKGFKSPELIDKTMREKGLFKDAFENKEYLIPDGGEPGYFKRIKGATPNRSWNKEEIVYDNLNQAKNKLNKQNDEILEYASGRLKPIETKDLINNRIIMKSVEEELYDQIKVDPGLAEKFKGIIKKITRNSESMKITDIKAQKDVFQRLARGTYTSKDSGIMPEGKVYASLARGYNNYLEDILDESFGDLGAKFRRNSKDMSDFMIQSDMVASKIAKIKGISSGMPVQVGTGPIYMISRATEKVGKSMPLAFGRAAVGDKLKQIPYGLGGAIESGIKQAPMRALLPSSKEDGGMFGNIANIPELILKTPIPRDSKSIVENKEFVLDKIMLQMPQMHEYVSDVLNTQPHKIQEILPMIIQAAPALFESDEYNRVDGKLLTAEDKANAIADTSKRDDLSNTEKIKILNNIGRKGVM